MISTTSELQDICTKLDEVLDRPQAFGLGKTIPKPLADRLQEIQEILRRALRQPDEMNGDLEVELSQDSDCVV